MRNKLIRPRPLDGNTQRAVYSRGKPIYPGGSPNPNGNNQTPPLLQKKVTMKPFPKSPEIAVNPAPVIPKPGRPDMHPLPVPVKSPRTPASKIGVPDKPVRKIGQPIRRMPMGKKMKRFDPAMAAKLKLSRKGM